MYKLRKCHVLKALSRLVACYGVVAFIVTSAFLPTQSYAQSVLNLPAPGVMVTTSTVFIPPVLKGLIINPEQPFQFDFVFDSGDSVLTKEEIQDESTKLIKYFLASLTMPEDELWVNLSPYEKDRIIPYEFGKTEMGRDLLAQDYLLKQLTASLIYPEDGLGKEFWDRVYEKSNKLYGTSEIPVNTFNKVWIVPDKALIFENGDRAFIVETHMKVMLEEDYFALEQNSLEGTDVEKLSEVSSSIIREVIIPEIEKEVNNGKNFAKLRQIYHSFILAAWYKKNLHQSILGQKYANQKKVVGLETSDKNVIDKIYQQYLNAFEKGVYDFIKEDYDETTQELIPRKYFSGGVKVTSSPIKTQEVQIPEFGDNRHLISVNFHDPTNPTSGASSPIGGWFKDVSQKRKQRKQEQALFNWSKEALVRMFMSGFISEEKLTKLLSRIRMKRLNKEPGAEKYSTVEHNFNPPKSSYKIPIYFPFGKWGAFSMIQHEMAHIILLEYFESISEEFMVPNEILANRSYMASMIQSYSDWIISERREPTSVYEKMHSQKLERLKNQLAAIGISEETVDPQRFPDFEEQIFQEALRTCPIRLRNSKIMRWFNASVEAEPEVSFLYGFAIGTQIYMMTKYLEKHTTIDQESIRKYADISFKLRIIFQTFRISTESGSVQWKRVNVKSIHNIAYQFIKEDIHDKQEIMKILIQNGIPSHILERLTHGIHSIIQGDSLYSRIHSLFENAKDNRKIDRVSSPVESDQPGGIDFNPSYLNIQSQGNKVQIPVSSNPKEYQKIKINGLVPFIFNITPITNIPMILGESEDKPDAILSQL